MGLLSNNIKDHDKMKKTLYEVPQTRILEIKIQGRILDGSIGTVSVAGVSGWTSEEEDW